MGAKTSVLDILRYHLRVGWRAIAIVLRNPTLWGTILVFVAFVVGSGVTVFFKGTAWTIAELDVNAWTVIGTICGLIALLLVYASLRAPAEIDAVQRRHLSNQIRISRHRGEMIARLKSLSSQSEVEALTVARTRLRRHIDRVRGLRFEKKSIGSIRIDSAMRAIEIDLSSFLVDWSGMMAAARAHKPGSEACLDAASEWLSGMADRLTATDLIALSGRIVAPSATTDSDRRRVTRAKEAIDTLVVHGEYIVQECLDYAAFHQYLLDVRRKLPDLIGERHAQEWIEPWRSLAGERNQRLAANRSELIAEIERFIQSLRDLADSITVDRLTQRFLDGTC